MPVQDRNVGSGRSVAEDLGRRSPSLGLWAAAATLLLGFVAATNRWISWNAGFRLLLPHDEADYRVIASSAPHLPSVKLPEQHAQRFPFHYLVGILAHAGGLNVESAYTVVVIFLAVALAGLLGVVLATIGVSDEVFVICLGVFVLNTYSLRYYGIAPGMTVDLVFEAGLLVALLGLLRRSYLVVLTGVVIATLARQSAVPASLAVAAWLCLGPGWREASPRARIVRAGAVVLLSVVLFVIVVQVATPFSAATTPDFSHWTMLADLERLPSGLGDLGQHFLRAANGLFGVTSLILAAAAAAKARRPRGRLPVEFWWCMLLAAVVVAQPVIFSPEYAAHNETRLAVLAIPTLATGLGFLLKDLEHQIGRITTTTTLILTAILAVGSLHHLYTVIGTATAKQTVVLQAITAVCLAAVLLRSTRRPWTPVESIDDQRVGVISDKAHGEHATE
jgi:hypothetical protein